MTRNPDRRKPLEVFHQAAIITTLAFAGATCIGLSIVGTICAYRMSKPAPAPRVNIADLVE